MIAFADLYKAFGANRVLEGFTLDVHDGETMVIIGYSGTGKSVAIKHVVGLLEPDAGHVKVDGKVVSDLPRRELTELRATIGYVFQFAALFDSMTVFENVALGLRRLQNLSEDEIAQRVREALKLVDLPRAEPHMPSELSGGMRKRVGLARAIALRPKYILYDEPTTGLDPVTSAVIDQLIVRTREALGVTSIVITHDMRSAYTVGDRIAMLYQGKVQQVGTVEAIKATEDQVVRQFIEGRPDGRAVVRASLGGALAVGDPVLLRGVRIGRVESIRLATGDWVDVGLRFAARTQLPRDAVALFASTTLFGDWSVQITSLSTLRGGDPDVLRQVTAAGVKLPAGMLAGAALPDVGQLTAQAGRIASDIATISTRVQDAFDSTSAARLKSAFSDLSRLSAVLKTIAQGQESTLTRIGGNIDTGTALLAQSARNLARAASRVDSATSRDQLQRILGHTDTVTADLTAVAANVRTLSSAAASQQEAFMRIVARTDSMLARIQAGEGTLGRLSRDTTLYSEAVETVRSLRSLLQDIQKNPRRYFSFSVF